MKTYMPSRKNTTVDVFQRWIFFSALRDVFLPGDTVGHENIDCKNTEDEDQDYENYDYHDRIKICSYLRL